MTSSVTISTFNVLHDLNKWVSPVLQPSKRFDFITKALLNSSSDIYCLNEITPSFWPRLILKVQSKYPYYNQPMIKSRGISVVILSKWPLKILHQSQSLVIAYVNGLIVVATHLVALEHQYEKRENQIIKIVELLKEKRNISLEKQIRQAFEKRNIIILGDLNLHLINETLMVYRHDFYDAWMELEKSKEGFTWDPKINPIIGWFLPFDNRRMRLDRILIKQNSHIKPRKITIDFSEKIPNTWILFPSDHFGLTLTFDIQNEGYQSDHASLLQRIPNKKLTGFRPMKIINRYRKISMVVFIILIVLLIRYLYRLLM